MVRSAFTPLLCADARVECDIERVLKRWRCCKQAQGGDRFVGLGLLLFSISVFVYYTCWVIVSVRACELLALGVLTIASPSVLPERSVALAVLPCSSAHWQMRLAVPSLIAASPRVALQPFVEPHHFFHSFFPDRYWAIVIPVVLMILGVTLVGTFLALVMIRKGKKPKSA
jgi:hypothetical protein